MSLFDECERELQHLRSEVDELYKEMFSLMEKVQDVSVFSLDGLEIQGEWKGVDKKFKRIILRVKYKTEELKALSSQGAFTERQAHNIGELWNVVIARIQTTSSLIEDVINILRNNNLFVEIVVWFEEIWEGVKMALRVAAKVIVKGTALLLGESAGSVFLPPQRG